MPTIHELQEMGIEEATKQIMEIAYPKRRPRQIKLDSRNRRINIKKQQKEFNRQMEAFKNFKMEDDDLEALLESIGIIHVDKMTRLRRSKHHQ